MAFKVGHKINLGKKQTEEHKLKISKALFGRKNTWGKKISQSKMGHGWPEGYHEKQSIAQKKRFEKETVWNKGKYKTGKIGYYSLHNWVYSKLGAPKKCEICGTTESKRYQWANKSGKYLQDVSDWFRLCPKCHVYYDGTVNNLKYYR